MDRPPPLRMLVYGDFFLAYLKDTMLDSKEHKRIFWIRPDKRLAWAYNFNYEKHKDFDEEKEALMVSYDDSKCHLVNPSPTNYIWFVDLNFKGEETKHEEKLVDTYKSQSAYWKSITTTLQVQLANFRYKVSQMMKNPAVLRGEVNEMIKQLKEVKQAEYPETKRKREEGLETEAY